MTQILISLSEIGRVLSKKPVDVETEALRAGMEIVADRRGRPALRAADAQSLGERPASSSMPPAGGSTWRPTGHGSRAGTAPPYRLSLRSPTGGLARRTG